MAKKRPVKKTGKKPRCAKRGTANRLTSRLEGKHLPVQLDARGSGLLKPAERARVRVWQYRLHRRSSVAEKTCDGFILWMLICDRSGELVEPQRCRERPTPTSAVTC
ncbi:MAG: hypothetical protein JWN13_3461 [Betaproteobacteria bacterium]|nr:hypothetical protein [Betaproteobacteria bacterium]